MKYIQNIQNNPKFDQGVSNNVGWLQKNEAEKTKKFFPECLNQALGEDEALGEEACFPEC
jgi:hypothetical protein